MKRNENIIKKNLFNKKNNINFRHFWQSLYVMKMHIFTLKLGGSFIMAQGRINKFRKLLGIICCVIFLLLVIAFFVIIIATITPILVVEDVFIVIYRVMQILVVVSIIVALVVLGMLLKEIRSFGLPPPQNCDTEEQIFKKMWIVIVIYLLFIAGGFSNILYPIQTNYSIAISVTLFQIVIAAILIIGLRKFKDKIQAYVDCLSP